MTPGVEWLTAARRKSDSRYAKIRISGGRKINESLMKEPSVRRLRRPDRRWQPGMKGGPAADKIAAGCSRRFTGG
uniref:Uncharacterized protein n=1 Tax=Sphaerodactylus townsendi TaxID=933632 RepID=A0ACB8G0U6_9SAUR